MSSLGKIYQLKISLKNSPSQFWIRVLIDSDSTFEILRDLIKDEFNDYGSFYVFTLRKGPASSWVQIFGADNDVDDQEIYFEDGDLDSRSTKLNEIFGKYDAKTLTHTYDFAHDCGHSVFLEKVFVKKISQDDECDLPRVIKRKGQMTERIYKAIHHGESWLD